MARDGYLIMDSDLHMMEPDDLWARYLDEPYRQNPPRLFGAHQAKRGARVAVHDVKSAGEEARRSVTEVGAVASVGTPNAVNGHDLHDEACEPLWDLREELDGPIGFHPTGNTALKDDAGRRYVGHA